MFFFLAGVFKSTLLKAKQGYIHYFLLSLLAFVVVVVVVVV